MARREVPALSWTQVLAHCWRYWRRQLARFSVVIGLIIAMVAADVGTPLAVGAMVGAIAAGPEAIDTAWFWLAVMGTTMTMQVILRFLLGKVWNRFSAAGMSALQTEAFGRVQRFSTDWHGNTFSGATVHRLSRARWSFEAISDILFIRLAPPLLLLCIVGAILSARLPAAGIAFYGVAALYITLSVIVSAHWVRPANIAAARMDSEMTGAIADAIANNAAVKAFGAEGREDGRLEKIASQWRHAALTSFDRSTDLNAIQQLTWTLLQAAVLGALAAFAAQGTVSPADIAFAVAANFQLAGYLRNIGGEIRMLQRAFGEFAEAADFLEAPFQVADVAAPAPLRPGPGAINFDAVSFGYGGKAKLYQDFSLAIAPGERVGLVGPSGSGKSTFVKLLQRLYDVDGGAVLLDGVDIATLAQADLRRVLSIVPQDPALFHRSLAENIAYARPDASREDVIAAAKRARAHDFIMAAPKGYDTLVGERGVKLSGGERQRVAIARAFLADAPVLILDEATSSVDTITERLIQEAIEELMHGRTTILIAHRLSTVRRADRILVFDQGRIVEHGKHDELMARPGGRYRALHEQAVGLEAPPHAAKIA